MRRRRRSRPAAEKSSKGLRLNRRCALAILAILGGAGVVCGGWLGLRSLGAHVDGMLLRERPDALVDFVDLPKELYSLANHDLQRSLFDVLGREWTDDALCGQMASRLAEVGWVARVHYVRRTGGGRFEISCRYRIPAAMVLRGDDDGFLVDDQAARLPGKYVTHPAWRVIEGVDKSAPAPGRTWEGEDIRAALAVLSAVAAEPYAGQIAGVSVANFAGRRDPRSTHLELLTDRPAGRIRWGSAPGLELEENGVPQKLALLRENFGRTGRADAQHVVIDVSVFPDRFTVPG